jgi:hypothetical protein
MQKRGTETRWEVLLLTGFLTVQVKVRSLSPGLTETLRTDPPWDTTVREPKDVQL